MKQLLIALFAAVLGTSAFAADMPLKALPPPAPIDIWTGGYAGLNGGYGWGHDSVGSSATPGACNTVGFGGCDLPPVNAVSSASATALTFSTSVHHDGFLYGGQAGYNWLVRNGASNWNAVFGVEVDFQGITDSRNTTMLSSTPVPGCPAVCAAAFVVAQQATLNEKLTNFGTVRGRAGLLVEPNTLIYATGGLAFAHASASALFIQTGVPLFGSVIQPWGGGGSVTKELYGPTVGGGVEWKWSAQWSLKAEYLYADLGSLGYNTLLQSMSTGGRIYSTANASTTSHVYENIARVGFNYKFY
jgi:outer membrane immunogenic protein